MTRTFKVLSAILGYPTAQLQEAMPSSRQLLRVKRCCQPRFATNSIG